MIEIISRFKRLNKDSKKYLQKRRKLKERYKYLSIISPHPNFASQSSTKLNIIFNKINRLQDA